VATHRRLPPSVNGRVRLGRGGLQSVDAGVKKAVATLKATGQLKNTVVVYTSDNGYLTGQHSYYGKLVSYNESLRIPVVMAGPKIPHKKVATQITNPDLPVTFAALAHATPTRKVDGRNVLPYLHGPTRYRTIPIEGWPVRNGTHRLYSPAFSARGRGAGAGRRRRAEAAGRDPPARLPPCHRRWAPFPSPRCRAVGIGQHHARRTPPHFPRCGESIVMERYGLNDERAFAFLQRLSSHRNEAAPGRPGDQRRWCRSRRRGMSPSPLNVSRPLEAPTRAHRTFICPSPVIPAKPPLPSRISQPLVWTMSFIWSGPGPKPIRTWPPVQWKTLTAG